MHEFTFKTSSTQGKKYTYYKSRTSLLKKKPGILGTDKEFLNSIIISVLHLQKLKILII